MLSIIRLIGGLWIGYGFVKNIVPTPIANEGLLLFVYIATGLIGLFGAVIGYSMCKAINEMKWNILTISNN